MPRVQLYQGGQIAPQGTTGARVQSADFGPGIGGGVKDLGQSMAQTANTLDQIENIKARIEANELLVEHSELSRQIGNGVKQTLGSGAEAAADKGIVDLDKGTESIIGRASPRARLILQSELGGKNVITKDSFLDHGFREKVTAFESSSVAAIERIVEDAADEPDEEKAEALLTQVGRHVDDRTRFFGRSEDWQRGELQKYVSGFYKSRALKMAVGHDGSSLLAIEYANANRDKLSDDDYNSIVTSFHDNAADEWVVAEQSGKAVPSATTDEQPDGSRALDPMAFFKSFTIPHEGRTYVIDSNGAGAKYGINAEHNPGVDVKNLTEAQAAEIFRKKYFIKSGADKLPPALAAVHVDTFYLNERQASKILRESGGDPDKYIQLRQQFLDGLVRANPAKYGRYQKGWTNRTNALAQFSQRQGGARRGLPIGPETDLTSYRETVMARTDIGLALKTKLIQRAEGLRAEARGDREAREGAANRALTQTALNLGEKFTDVKQLPQNVWMTASPATRAAFANMAKSNRENRPLSPDLAAYINFVEISDPKRFISREFRDEIATKGAPLDTIRTVAARQGEIAGTLANPKAVDPIADGTLWTIAKPAFEAAGILLDSREARTPSKVRDERIADAQRKDQAIRHLRGQMTQWMAVNPGKKPDDALIRGWVGQSLLRTGKESTTRVFEAPDAEIVTGMNPNDRAKLIAEFRRQGIKPTPELMAAAWRRAAALQGRRQ